MADRALVTGAAGFVGLHLVRRLLEEGVDVVAVDDLSRGVLDADAQAVLRHAQFVEHDLTAPLPASIPACDEVFHLAAVVGVGNVTSAPARVIGVNVAATARVVEWCAVNPPRSFVFSSTSEVADGAVAAGLVPVPVAEDVPFVVAAPHSARASYATSKVVGELLVSHAGIAGATRIVRFFNVYGPRMGTQHVIPQFACRVLDGEDPFAIYGGENRRAFCHVDDAVAATLAVARHPGTDPSVVNVGDDREEVTMTELAATLFEVAGVARTLKVEPAPAGSPDRRCPDVSVLRHRIGYEATTCLRDGLARTFEWYARSRARDALPA